MTTEPDPRPPSPARSLMDRRRFLLTSSGALIGVGLAACTNDSGSKKPAPTTTGGGEAAPELTAPGSAGLIDEDAFQKRIDEYLIHATAGDSAGGTVGVAANLIRAQRDESYTWDASAVTEATFADQFEKIDQWEDTRDFDLMYLYWLLELGAGNTDTTRLSPDVLAAIEQRFIDNRYRWDDPLPADRVDNLWFWSENHIIINLTLEYLAGSRWADQTFTISGLTGAEHAERARVDILEWVHERLELGFFEWHSNVYMLKNITPLTMLAELAGDPELTEVHAVLDRFRELGIGLVCVTAGSPYYNPHIQRPAYFPPSDGYAPPNDPLVDVARLLAVAAELAHEHPDVAVVGSGYSYLQDHAAHVAQAVLRRGDAASIGLGRMALSYPTLPADVLAGRPLDRRAVCRTFSDCTTAPRHGLVSGCYPLDDFYKDRPERIELAAIKRRTRTNVRST